MVEKLVAARIASVIDQNIYPTQAFHQGLRHVLHLLRIGHIAGNCEAAATHCLNLSDECFELTGSASGHGHICPRLGERQGDAAAYSTSCTGHNCSPSRERNIVLTWHCRYLRKILRVEPE